eukprot:COSAG01_NODE_12528_length_1725_cov_3.019065_1_plen_207_part_00
MARHHAVALALALLLASAALSVSESAAAAAATTTSEDESAFVLGVNPPEELELGPQPSRELDKAGASVALDAGGGVALVGVPGRNQALAFVRTECAWGGAARGCWVRSGVLGTGVLNGDAKLGGAVALAGDGATALVGARGRNLEDGASRMIAAGSVYVYAQRAEQWQSEATLVALDVRAGDRFGEAVALSGGGDAAVAGSPGRDE